MDLSVVDYQEAWKRHRLQQESKGKLREERKMSIRPMAGVTKGEQEMKGIDGDIWATSLDDELMFDDIPRTESMDALERRISMMNQTSAKNVIQAVSAQVSMKHVMFAGSSRRGSMTRKGSMKNVIPAGNSQRDSMKDVMLQGSSLRGSFWGPGTSSFHGKTSKHVSSAGHTLRVDNVLFNQASFVEADKLLVTLPDQVHNP